MAAELINVTAIGDICEKELDPETGNVTEGASMNSMLDFISLPYSEPKFMKDFAKKSMKNAFHMSPHGVDYGKKDNSVFVELVGRSLTTKIVTPREKLFRKVGT